MAVPPIVAMRRSDAEQQARRAAPLALAAGAILAAVALGLLALWSGAYFYGLVDPALQRTDDSQITVADLTGVAVQDIQISKAVYQILDESSSSG